MYSPDQINAALARVDDAKVKHPVGWRMLAEFDLDAEAMTEFAFRIGDAHLERLNEEDDRVIYAAAWLQGLAVGVALGQGER